MDYSKPATEISVRRSFEALSANGTNVKIAENKKEARNNFFNLLPRGAEVMNMTSMTLEELDIPKEINESGNFDSIRKKLESMDRKTQGKDMQRLGAAPVWVCGSVHAITEDGSVLIASNTGSQLPAYAYGASHVIWIAGTNKIVKDKDEAIKRIYKHSLPLEDKRARKVYGTGSAVNKLLVINKELIKGRINLILVKESLGF